MNLKLIKLSLSLSLVFFVISCSKEDNLVSENEFQTTFYRPDSFYYNCVKFVPSIGSSVAVMGNAHANLANGAFGIALTNYSDTSNWKLFENWAYQNEIITIEYNKLSLGKFIVSTEDKENINIGVAKLYKVRGDIPVALYQIDEQQISWVEVSKIDSTLRFIEGKFNLHFILKYRLDEYSHIANRLTFANGEFKAKTFF